MSAMRTLLPFALVEPTASVSVKRPNTLERMLGQRTIAAMLDLETKRSD